MKEKIIIYILTLLLSIPTCIFIQGNEFDWIISIIGITIGYFTVYIIKYIYKILKK